MLAFFYFWRRRRARLEHSQNRWDKAELADTRRHHERPENAAELPTVPFQGYELGTGEDKKLGQPVCSTSEAGRYEEWEKGGSNRLHELKEGGQERSIAELQ